MLSNYVGETRNYGPRNTVEILGERLHICRGGSNSTQSAVRRYEHRADLSSGAVTDCVREISGPNSDWGSFIMTEIFCSFFSVPPDEC